jgi:hypothetical protein
VQGGGGVEPAGEGNADLLADGQGFKNYGHGLRNLVLNTVVTDLWSICRVESFRRIESVSGHDFSRAAETPQNRGF